MSSCWYFASTKPLAKVSNPHYRTLSVKEALALGIKGIPDFMLTNDFDQEKKDVLLWSDLEGLSAHESFADDFAILPVEKALDFYTEKPYCAILEWEYTSARAEQILAYVQQQLKDTNELELWHIWMAEAYPPRFNKRRIAANALTVSDLAQLNALTLWQEPITHYAYVIYR